jgi:uncharacterized membrane protein (UPF0127 family)
MRVFLRYKTKKSWLEVKSCNWFKRFLGLMFIRQEKAEALLFDFKKPVKIAIHSCFVFFPFAVIWLDNKNKIVDLRIVKPFRLSVCSKKSFTKIIEIPVNKKYREVIKFLCS